jgi:geranylgeranyl diphosphate synthase type II
LAEFDEKYKEYLDSFTNSLNDFCNQLNCTPKILDDSLKYSLLLGGKRVRPVLMFAAGEIIGVDREELKPFAVALELIHTYSLIHDDLPEMDNDDYRRGKLSNHKVFGTGNAVLAGDGLLNTAYSLLFEQCFKGSDYISAAKYICDCAGVYGMIAGQSADLFHENDNNVDEDTLNFIYNNKTGKLITAALTVPSIISGGKYFNQFKALGQNLGYLFQLTDDILDVEGDFTKLGKSIGKDDKEGKYTSVRLYGIDACKQKVKTISQVCHDIIDEINCGNKDFLHSYIDYLKTRLG